MNVSTPSFWALRRRLSFANDLRGALLFLILALTPWGSAGFISAQCVPTATANPKGQGCVVAEEQVRYTDASGVVAAGNGLTRISGSGWNAGAASTARVHAGGYFYTVAQETNTNRMVGLSATNPNTNFNSIQYAFYLRSNGLIGIYESGNNRGDFGTYAAGDTLRIVHEGTRLVYYHNQNILRTISIEGNPSLLVDASLNTTNSTVAHVHIGNITSGTFSMQHPNAGADPAYEWTLNGSPVGGNSSTLSINPLVGDLITCTLTPGTGSCTPSNQISNTIRIKPMGPISAGDFHVTIVQVPNGCIQTSQPVQWNPAALLNTVANGGHVSKVQSGGNWDGGAFSLNHINDNGYFEFTNNEITRKAIGLSHTNPDAGLNSIQYAFLFENSGTLRIYESGTDRGTFGTYAIGDVFRIAVDNGTVKYYRNGSLIRISSVAPYLPLMADVSLREVGATVANPVLVGYTNGTFNAFATNAGPSPNYQWFLNGNPTGSNNPTYSNPSLQPGDQVWCALNPDINGCSAYTYHSVVATVAVPETASPHMAFYIRAQHSSAACLTTLEQVSWTDLLNVEATSNNLRKVQSGGNWDGGAASRNAVHDFGYFEFTNSELLRKTVGLSHTNPNANFNTIQYGFHFETTGTLRIYESGNDRGTFGTYAVGDVFRIAVDAGVVKYFINNNLLRISSVAPTLPLRADVSLRDLNATVTNALIHNQGGTTFTAHALHAGDGATYQWKLNGVNVGTGTNTYTNNNLIDGDEVSCTLTPSHTGCSAVAYLASPILISQKENSSSINFYISGDATASACATATENVVWNTASLLNVQANGSNLVKVQSGGNWNGNAASLNMVLNNGYFEFVNSEITRKAVGLSHTDANADLNTIQYAFHFESNGNLRIYESGTDRGLQGNYAVGDVFRIAIEAGQVQYFRNGNLLRVSNVLPTLPLLADVSLRDVNATVTQATITNFNEGSFTAYASNPGPNPTYQWKVNGTNAGTNSPTFSAASLNAGDVVTCDITPDLAGCAGTTFASNPVVFNTGSIAPSIDFYLSANVAAAGCYLATETAVWDLQSLNNVTASGANLTKVQGGNAWNGGAASLNKVANNGYFEFLGTGTARRAIGLSHTNPDNGLNSIQYAFLFETNGSLRIYESGNNRGTFGTHSTGDVFRIAVEDGAVKYYRNGTLLRISTVAPTLPLMADVSLHDVNATLAGATIANFNGGAFAANVDNAGPNPSFQWMLNGSPVGSNSPAYSNNNLQDGDIITCILTPDIPGCASTAIESNTITIQAVDNPVTINFYITAVPSTVACNTTVEEVVWNAEGLVNVEPTANNLVKIQGGNAWNAGASSLNRVHNNGYFEFTASETNRRRAVGLSHADPNVLLGSIQYAFDLNHTGVLRIRESGTDRGNFGPYATGDKLRIAVENGVVKYFRNGTLLRVSNIAPTLPLLVDVAINTVQGTVQGAVISNYNGGTFTANLDDAGPSPTFQWQVNGTNAGTNSPTFSDNNLADGDIVTCILTPDLGGCGAVSYTSNSITKVGTETAAEITFYIQAQYQADGYALAVENVAWNPASLNRVEASANNLVKILNNNNWNGNASSFNSVKDGGYFEFTVTETNRRRMVGLSHTDASNSFNTIQYAFDLDANGILRIYESGVLRGAHGSYATGDQLRIAVSGTQVTYYRNGNPIRNSTVPPTLPLIADVSIRDVNGTVTNAVIANQTNGTFTAHVQNAGASPVFQWRVNGNNVGLNSLIYTNLNLLDGDLVTCQLTPSLSGCGTSSFASNSIRIEGPDGTTHWTGIVSNAWNHSGNWSQGIPNENLVAIIPPGTPYSPLISTPAIARSVHVHVAAQLSMASATLNVLEDFLMEGSFTAGTGKVTFTGDLDSRIQGGTTRFNRLVVQKTNPARIILESGIEIAQDVVFTTGIIETGAWEVHYIQGASPGTGHSASYIEGTVRKTGNEAFRFPIGRNGIYAPAAISAPSVTTDAFTANYFDQDPEESGYTTALRPASLETLSRCEHWIINRAVGTSAVSVSLSYDAVRSCGVADPAQLRIARWNGSSWQDHGYLIHTGTETAGMVTSGTPITTFSPFTLGSGSPINPLPIELLTFDARVVDRRVDLRWITAAEINNDFFTIERSADAVQYHTIATVKGAGNSSGHINYAHSDLQPLPGTSYYRLVQTDYDGTSKTYPARAVTFGESQGLQIYPNPNKGSFRVSVPAAAKTADVPSTLRLINAGGALVWQRSTQWPYTDVDVHLLPPGVYILEWLQGSHLERSRVVIQ